MMITMYELHKCTEAEQAYFTILGHQPSSATFTRSAAQKNISEILRLHDELLGQLHRIVPFAEFDHRTAKSSNEPTAIRSHTRWHSVDAVLTRSTPVRSKLATIRQGRRSLNISRSSGDDENLLCCNAQVVAGVARTFSQFVG